MAVSYKKLWHLLIDLDMKKQDLRKKANVAPASLSKMAKGETVTTDTIEKICKALKCDVADIMEIVPDIIEEKSDE